MKCKEIQEKQKVKLQLKNKKKVQSLKEKGITLIALVVTIIILLILAGVTLNMAMSGNGLFSRARNAADKYKKAQEDEQDLISEIGKEMNSEYVGAYITGYEPTEGSCTITGAQSGTGEDQTFTTAKEQEKLSWRIWDYDGTILRIILDKPTKQTLKLTNVNGYNNGVWAINEVCRKCFGQYEEDNYNGKMKTGISVANLRRSDIEKVSTYDYTKYKHKVDGWEEVIDDSADENLIHYGELKKDIQNKQVPTMWSSHDSKWGYEYDKDTRIGLGDPSCENPWEQEYGDEIVTENGSTTAENGFKQSYYAHDYIGKEYEFKNSNYYKIIFGNNPYFYFWLAGRFLRLGETSFDVGLNCVRSGSDFAYVYGTYVFSTGSGGGVATPNLPFRPVVSINLETSGYNLVKNNENDGAQYKLTRKVD